MTVLQILQHALGRDEYGQRRNGATKDYRNHFVIDEGSDDIATCREAVAAGLMTENARRFITSDPIFLVTEKGKAFVDENSPKPPPVSKGRARYHAYLRSGAADAGQTFGDWLRSRGRE